VTPRFLHSCILIALVMPAAVFGWNVWSRAEGSGSYLSGLGVVIGAGIFGAAVLYAALTTAIVLKKITTWKGVVVLHLLPFGVALVVFARRMAMVYL
jgi:hypothetical protein